MAWTPRMSTTKINTDSQGKPRLHQEPPQQRIPIFQQLGHLYMYHLAVFQPTVKKKLSASYRTRWGRTSWQKTAVLGWLQLYLWGRLLVSCECVLTIERSTGKLPKMPTPCHWWMKCKIVYLDLPFLVHLTCKVNTGRCPYIPGIRRRPLFVQVQEWACISSSRCHLGWQALPVHLSVSWPKYFVTYHLSPGIWTMC